MNERERLIELIEDGNCCYLSTEKCKNLMCECRTCCEQVLANYLLENGVVVLPCKIGDTVYIIPKYNGKPYCGVISDKIQMIGITSRGYHIKTRGKSNFNKTYILGKTAFLTKAEAEQALKEGTENEL